MEEKTIKQAKLHAKYSRRRLESGSRELPWLNLTGVWLEKAGFGIGQKIEIKIEERQLTIKAI